MPVLAISAHWPPRQEASLQQRLPAAESRTLAGKAGASPPPSSPLRQGHCLRAGAGDVSFPVGISRKRTRQEPRSLESKSPPDAQALTAAERAKAPRASDRSSNPEVWQQRPHVDAASHGYHQSINQPTPIVRSRWSPERGTAQQQRVP